MRMCLIKDYCKKVISSLPQMENGAFHSEIFINSDRCLLCEIASRSAGGGITACINNSFQFDFYEEWAKTLIYLGEMACAVALTVGSVKGAQNLTSRALGL